MSSIFSQEMTIFHLPKESSLKRPYNSACLPGLIASVCPLPIPAAASGCLAGPACAAALATTCGCCPWALHRFPPLLPNFPFSLLKRNISHKPSGSSLCQMWAIQIPFSAEKNPSADFFLDWEIWSPAAAALPRCRGSVLLFPHLRGVTRRAVTVSCPSVCRSRAWMPRVMQS